MIKKDINFSATSIETRLRSYNSEPFRNRSIPHLVGKALLYHVTFWGLMEKFAGYDDQLCLTKLNERGAKEIKSTGITKEMLEEFERDRLSPEDNILVIKFLKDATDQTLSDFNSIQLKQISRLILNHPEKLVFIKRLLQSPSVNELLPILSKASYLLEIFDSATLDKIVPLDTPYLPGSDEITSKLFEKIINSSQSTQKTLGEYKLLQNQKMTPELLYSILNSPAALDLLPRVDKMLQHEEVTTELLAKIITLPQARQVLKTLVDRPDLLGSDLDKILTSKNVLHALEKARWDQYMTIPLTGYILPNSNQPPVYLNQDEFVDNPTIGEWNVLPQKEGPIDNDAWNLVQTRLADIFDAVYKERDDERSRLFNFLTQCMETADAKTPKGEQVIRKRVDAIVTVLEKYLTKMHDPDLPEEKIEAIRKGLIGRTLDIMAVGGSSCPDRAIVLLRNAENHIKLFENPKYLPNIIVNMFKLDLITQILIDEDNGENIETYLSYTLKLSNLLELGVSGNMLYEEHYGKTEPLEQALPKLCAAFTPEKLIKFAAGLEEFRSFFADAKDKALQAKQKEYMDTYDMEDEKKAEEARVIINDELKNIEDSFFTNTARQIFLDAGFLTTTTPPLV